MSFYSREFLFLFLPLTVAAYHLLAQRDLRRAKYFLIAASFFAFSWQAPLNLAAFVPSVAVNWLLGRALLRRAGRRRGLLALGVGLNVALLAAVKYLPVYAAAALGRPAAHTGFAWMLGMLGISFYTFQQISWLRDCAAGRVERPDFRDYLLFLCFFPKFYSGPIVYYGETAEQFATAPGPDWEAMGRGLFLLCLGLAKKVLVADALAGYAAGAFDQSVRLPFLDAWAGSLAYTFQLYYDFSGYTDMARGMGLLFGIRMLENFDSPYRATSIRDFWRRWHVSLGRFIRDHLYIPLGGSRVPVGRGLFNLLVVFAVIGVWHGAGINFLIWGLLHGAGMVAHRLWSWLRRPLPRALAWFLTFNFVNVCWVFFRATSLADALKVLRAMAGLNGFAHLDRFIFLNATPAHLFALLGALLAAALLLPPPGRYAETRRFGPAQQAAAGACLLASVLFLSAPRQFIYFVF